METPTRGIAELTSGSSAQLRAILDLCRRMNAERKVGPLLTLVTEEAARLMDADRATIFLLDSERCELWAKVALGGESIRFDARLGIAGAALMQGRLINVHDAQQDERFYQSVDAKTGYKTHSVLAVPLRSADGTILGVFQALNKRGGAFTPADEVIAEALAVQVGLAVDNASTLQNLSERQSHLEMENTQLWREVEGKFSTRNIIGTSEQIQSIVRLIDHIRDTAVDVLITGESGTGKELVAKALHYTSPRVRAPFLALNCAALPENLVESELFGIERGVATGVDRRVGKFEEARGGTLFLDEIGDLSLLLQAKLLRVLQERELTRVGGRAPIQVDVRIIAATNVDLDEAIKKGSFRSDLYYRLRVVRIHTPPLREIPEDIPVMAEYLLERLCQEMGRPAKKLTAGALRCLTAYRWPGNVRELENELKRLVASVRKTSISEEEVSEEIRRSVRDNGPACSGDQASLKTAVEELEVRMIREALRLYRGNQLHAARALGLSRQGLIKKIKRYNLTSR